MRKQVFKRAARTQSLAPPTKTEIIAPTMIFAELLCDRKSAYVGCAPCDGTLHGLSVRGCGLVQPLDLDIWSENRCVRVSIPVEGVVAMTTQVQVSAGDMMRFEAQVPEGVRVCLGAVFSASAPVWLADEVNPQEATPTVVADTAPALQEPVPVSAKKEKKDRPLEGPINA